MQRGIRFESVFSIEIQFCKLFTLFIENFDIEILVLVVRFPLERNRIRNIFFRRDFKCFTRLERIDIRSVLQFKRTFFNQVRHCHLVRFPSVIRSPHGIKRIDFACRSAFFDELLICLYKFIVNLFCHKVTSTRSRFQRPSSQFRIGAIDICRQFLVIAKERLGRSAFEIGAKEHIIRTGIRLKGKGIFHRRCFDRQRHIHLKSVNRKGVAIFDIKQRIAIYRRTNDILSILVRLRSCELDSNL